jgi:hypothetical protein
MIMAAMILVGTVPLAAVITTLMVSDRLWVLRFWKWIWFRNLILIKMMDYENDIYYTLATPRVDGVLIAPVYWSVGVGKVILLPSGIVHPKSASPHMYAWEHVDTNLKVQQALAQEHFMSVSDWAALSYAEKHDQRNKVAQEHDASC